MDYIVNFCNLAGFIVFVILIAKSLKMSVGYMRTLKNGKNLGSRMSQEEIFQLLLHLEYPSLEKVFWNENGKIVVKTKIYEYPVGISEKDGKTIIYFSANFLLMGKRKMQMVHYDLENLYLFIGQKLNGPGDQSAVNAIKRRKRDYIQIFGLIVLLVVFVVSAILLDS